MSDEEETEAEYQLRAQREHEIKLIKAPHAWVWPVCIAVVFVAAITGQVVQAVLTR